MVRRLSIIFAVVLLFGCSKSVQPPARSWTSDSDAIYQFYQDWQGAPYRLGGTTRGGVDCSGFVQRLYGTVFNVPLARTTEDQADQGYKVAESELRPGDLVFFKTGWFDRHVGVYLGRGQFVHASTSVGVTRSNLSNPYWRDAYWMSRRVLR